MEKECSYPTEREGINMIHTDGQPTVASRVQAAREESFKREETLRLAVELAATIGFCQGFLGKDRGEFASMLPDFPEDYRPEMTEAYRREFAEGAAFVSIPLGESVEIPISEIHPGQSLQLMEIRIGTLFFSTNEKETELYISREEEILGMAEIFPEEWKSFRTALFNEDISYNVPE